MFSRLSHLQLLRYAGLFTWACVGIPLVLNTWYFHEGLSRPDLLAWRAAFLLFGMGYWLLTRRIARQDETRVDGWDGIDIALLTLITASAIGVSHFSNSGLGGGLLLVIAGILPWVLSLRVAASWLVLQHAALIPVFVARPEFSLMEATLQALFYVGYSMVAFVTGLVARQQAQARAEQHRLNAELRATRALLAESSRLNERLRIARELHDLLGHHLTALSLHLEVASHLAEGRCLEQVRQAQLLAKLLLSDVRAAVSQLREDSAVDLAEALDTLARGVPSLRVELSMRGELVLDPVRAHALLRCVQEIITNAVRHSGADRLDLSLQRTGTGIHLQARDNGRGCEQLVPGNGLLGMRERLAEHGGQLDWLGGSQAGFGLELFLPLPLEDKP